MSCCISELLKVVQKGVRAARNHPLAETKAAKLYSQGCNSCVMAHGKTGVRRYPQDAEKQ